MFIIMGNVMKPIFDREVETWNSLYSGHGSGKYALFQDNARMRTERRMAFCLKMLNPSEGMNVLDVGCASGAFRRPIEANGARWTGLDFSLNMLIRGKELVGKGSNGSGWVNGAGEALPFTAAAFDAVICIGVVNFHRADVVRNFLSEICRVLKPGGTLIITSLRLDILTWVRSRMYPRIPLPFSSPGPLYPLHYQKALSLAEGLPLKCEEMKKVHKYLGLPHYTMFKFSRQHGNI